MNNKGNNTGQPSTRDLRRGAKHRVVEAAKALTGRSGMSKDEQIHMISHAKLALTEALLYLEQASHNLVVENSQAHIEHEIDLSVTEGIAQIEELLATMVDDSDEEATITTEGETE